MNYPYTLPDLPYAHDALEPVIDAQTMEIHHTKHHQGYVDKLNAALKKHDDQQKKSLVELLEDLDALPKDIRTAVQNSGGGHLNHTLFWEHMTPGGSTLSKDSSLAGALVETFGGIDDCTETFSEAAASVFGSGWAWLAADSEGGVHIHGMPNQDNPHMHGDIPLLGIDVWEHAYYLHYQNRRADYIKRWWEIVNWEVVEKRYNDAVA